MTTLSLIAFPGAPNLPLFAAIEQGYCADAGLDIRFETTPSSVYQFEQFGTGAFDIAFTAFDNVVAYSENLGAVKLDPLPDFRAVFGCTQLELSLVVAPDIATVEDLRGKTLALDAISTGFAFVLYEMLERLGLPRDAYRAAPVGATPERWRSVKDGEFAGTITIEPFTSIARAAGFMVLTSSSHHFPAYQGGVIAVRHDWAQANGEVLRAFLGVYQRGLAWVLDPANQEAGAELLARRMPEIQPRAIESVMRSLLSPHSGLTPNGGIIRDGAAEVLTLRSRYGPGDKQLTNIDKYLDLSFLRSIQIAAAP